MNGETRKFFDSVLEIFRTSRSNSDDVAALLDNVKNEIREIRNNIDNANDDMVLDMYLYRLKAAEAQYRHLLKMAKEGRQKETG